jgi:hypothetical protein
MPLYRFLYTGKVVLVAAIVFCNNIYLLFHSLIIITTVTVTRRIWAAGEFMNQVFASLPGGRG